MRLLEASRVIYRIGFTVKLAILFCAVKNYTGLFSMHRDEIKPITTRRDKGLRALVSRREALTSDSVRPDRNDAASPDFRSF